MSESLNQALLELSLKPGERRVVEVDGQHFEIRRIDGLLVDEGPMMPIILTDDDLAPDSIANSNIEIGPFYSE